MDFWEDSDREAEAFAGHGAWCVVLHVLFAATENPVIWPGSLAPLGWR